MKNFILLATLLSTVTAFAVCPTAQELTNVNDNWEMTITARHDQQVVDDNYNFTRDGETNIANMHILTGKKILKGQKLKVLFNHDYHYREDNKEIDRATNGVALLDGKLLRIGVTMNDTKTNSVTVGELISTIKKDYKVDCTLKQHHSADIIKNLSNSVQE